VGEVFVVASVVGDHVSASKMKSLILNG
jgi:hypothetical protein